LPCGIRKKGSDRFALKEFFLSMARAAGAPRSLASSVTLWVCSTARSMASFWFSTKRSKLWPTRSNQNEAGLSGIKLNAFLKFSTNSGFCSEAASRDFF